MEVFLGSELRVMSLGALAVGGGGEMGVGSVIRSQANQREGRRLPFLLWNLSGWVADSTNRLGAEARTQFPKWESLKNKSGKSGRFFEPEK
jgi:hypothetical protein